MEQEIKKSRLVEVKVCYGKFYATTFSYGFLVLIDKENEVPPVKEKRFLYTKLFGLAIKRWIKEIENYIK